MGKQFEILSNICISVFHYNPRPPDRVISYNCVTFKLKRTVYICFSLCYFLIADYGLAPFPYF